MLKLAGFAASNYYNVVKLALLEKGVPFEEQLALLEELEQTFRQLHAEPAKATATPAAPAPALGA